MHGLNSISVLGCGWLGFPLAKSLVNNGYNVKGSTTSMDKLADLSDEGIEPFLVHSPFPADYGDLVDFVHSDILIIAVPPGRDAIKQASYFELLKALAAVLPESKVKKVIFISSTSVYGEVNQFINESDEARPDSDAGKRMLKAEQIVSAFPGRLSVVRLAGLVGPGRHPGRFLAGKSGIPNGLAPVNLIHRDDVIGIILKIVTNENARGIYNAAAPCHPSKEEFYSLACRSVNLQPPVFIPEKRGWKVIGSIRLQEELNYTFRFPDLEQWLTHSTTL